MASRRGSACGARSRDRAVLGALPHERSRPRLAITRRELAARMLQMHTHSDVRTVRIRTCGPAMNTYARPWARRGRRHTIRRHRGHARRRDADPGGEMRLNKNLLTVALLA